MAKRRFILPGIQELTKKQDEVLALPLEDQHMIVGGPGTGKSVMALMRAKRASRADRTYCFLLYNHALREFTDQLYDGDMKSVQWQSWFWKEYKKIFSTNPPLLESERSTFKPMDWKTVVKKLEELEQNDEPNKLLLIIDEGQDMPPEFYDSLTLMGYEHLFVVSDQNQQIVKAENSSRQDIEIALALDTAEVIELKDNFRNNYAIARLAYCFYTGDPGVSAPELPEPPKHQLAVPLLFSYEEYQFDRMMNKILVMAVNGPSKLIGVICPTGNVVKKYEEALRKINHNNNYNIDIGSYEYGRHCDLRFDSGGIMLITAKSCKGLEFDSVFLADIEEHGAYENDEDQLKKLFYVMASRAIERVILLQKIGKKTLVDKIMPDDSLVLERKP